MSDVLCWCKPGAPALPVLSPHRKNDRCSRMRQYVRKITDEEWQAGLDFDEPIQRRAGSGEARLTEAARSVMRQMNLRCPLSKVTCREIHPDRLCWACTLNAAFDLADRAARENDLRARIEALHQRISGCDCDRGCAWPGKDGCAPPIRCAHCRTTWPCATIRALDDHDG